MSYLSQTPAPLITSQSALSNSHKRRYGLYFFVIGRSVIHRLKGQRLLADISNIDKDGQPRYPGLMNVNLTDELNELVRSKVDSGLYNSASEVIRAALRMMVERDQLRVIREEEFRKAVAKGVADLDEGRFTELADDAELRAFQDDVKARGRKRLTERSPSQG